MSLFAPKTNTTPGAVAPSGQRASIGRARPTAEQVKEDNAERGFGTFTPTAGTFPAVCEGLRKFTAAGSGVEYEVLEFKTSSPNGNVSLFTPDANSFLGTVERYCRVLEILGVVVSDDGNYDAEALKGVQCQVEVEVKDGKARLKWSGNSVGVLPPK